MYKLYAIFDLDRMNPLTFKHCIQFLPPERIEKARRYYQETDRKNCVLAYLLLLYALYKNYSIDMPRLAYSDTGKPYLSDYPNIHFNLSHCSDACICGISDSPIGVDIQDIQPFSQTVAKYCCSQNELHLLKQSVDPALEFTKIWAMKESYLKMTGTGITGNLSAIDTTKLTGNIPVFISNGCCIAVASAEFFREESICLI